MPIPLLHPFSGGRSARSCRRQGVMARAALCIFLFASGCAHIQPNYVLTMEGGADQIAQSLVKNLPPTSLGMTMLVAAPADAVTLDVGKFGLAMQELIITAMARHGARIAEAQLRKAPMITGDKGLVCLSRDTAKLKDAYKAGMMLVSSYIVREHDLVLTARVVNFTTNDIMAAAAVTLRRSASIDAMLETRGGGGEKVYEH